MSIFTSSYPALDIPEVLLPEYVLADAGRWGESAALIDGPTGRVLTYDALDAGVRSLAGGLAARGFTPGQVVAVIAPNVPEYAVVFHGVALAGGVVTTVNPTYTAREMHAQFVASGAVLAVTVGGFLDVVREAAESTSVGEVFLLDGAAGGESLASLSGAPAASAAAVGPDDVVALPYSSGTTGLAKGVMLTHRNLVANTAQTVAVAQLTHTDRVIAVLPFFHIYGMSVLMNSALRVGATVITMPRFDLRQFLQLHVDHRVTRAFVAPPIVVALAKHPMVDDYDLSSLTQVVSGAAPLSASLALEAAARVGCDVAQGYGMTEMSPVSHFTPPGGMRPGSVGVLVPNTEMRIVDVVEGRDLGVGDEGEVWVRGPQVMRGYLNDPDATATMLDADGWLRTGDIVRVEHDGHVFVVDRLKELIKVNAFQVAPAELEALLLTHPAIADAAVIGVPDDETGEAPVAFVVAKAGVDVDTDEVAGFVAGQVARYKQIKRVEIVDSIPKSASGKILRRILRANVSV